MKKRILITIATVLFIFPSSYLFEVLDNLNQEWFIYSSKFTIIVSGITLFIYAIYVWASRPFNKTR